MDGSAATTTLNSFSAGVSELKDQIPTAEDVAFDAATLTNAFHTLVQSFFTSAAFRLVIADFFSILRDLLAHAAGDVADTPIQVHDMAGDVEDRLKAQSMPSTVGLDDSPATVISLVDEARDRSEESANKMRGIKDEWKNLGREAADKIKHDIVLRLQQDDDGPPNIDIQKAVAQAVCRYAAVASPAAAPEINISRHDVANPASVIAKPLFRVVDVEVALREPNFKIDQRILNKLVLQPLMGPPVSRMVKKALEDKVRTGLEELSQGLGDAIVDVQQNATAREGAEGTPGCAAVIGDWVRALVKALIKHMHREDAECIDGLKATTRVDATLKGVVYTSTTAQQQPTATPLMAHDRSNNEVNAPAPRGGLEGDSEADAYETVVAVGGGSQLFPGKGGPYGLVGGMMKRGRV